MRALGRYVRILGLFTEGRSQWTIPEMATAMEVPGSTVYRSVQDMISANFLEYAGEAQYRLGARFIELDRMIRVTDPVYSKGTPFLQDVCVQARVPCVAVLARLYNDTVMSVSQAFSAADHLYTSYERGRPRPLTRGATSKVILAQLPARRLKRLMQGEGGNAGEIDEMRAELGGIRRQGFAITRGEVDAGRIGIAAPVLVAGRALIGSLSLVVKAEEVDPQQERRLALLVTSTARLLSDELASD